MAFRGWPVEAIEFFEGLEADNSKDYWQRHKQVYDEQVRGPLEALLADLEKEWGEGRIFRPYRDVRFSRDKSPYKTNIGAVLEGGGYIQLSSEGLGAGYGMWEMAPDQLERYREAVDDDASGKALERLAKTAEGKDLTVMSHAALKTAPKGYPKDHPRIELLRYKGLATWQEWPAGAWLGTKRAEDKLVTFLRASKPLGGWLKEHVGPSALPDPRR